MRFQERIQSVLRSPKLLCEILLQGHYDFTFDQMPISMRRMSRARRMNLIKSGTNLFYRRLRPWNMPLHMQVELTNYCNLRCPVCLARLDTFEFKHFPGITLDGCGKCRGIWAEDGELRQIAERIKKLQSK